jgi:hypothetical protein
MSERFSQVSYKLIKDVLVKRLGFELTEVPGSYYVFTDEETGVKIFLPILPSTVKNITFSHHRMIHEVLDKSGVMDGENFEALLKKQLEKSKPDILEKPS